MSEYKYSEQYRINVEKGLLDSIDHKTYTYPWPDIENDFKTNKDKNIAFVAYGSLLNPESYSMTFGNRQHSKITPVVAYGVRRIFNFQMPPNIPRYGPPSTQVNIAALNVRHTGKVNDVVNGILVRLPRHYITNLRDREIGYDLIPVVCSDWYRKSAQITPAYILCAPDELRAGLRRTNDKLIPHIKYYKVCREGAKTLGRDICSSRCDRKIPKPSKRIPPTPSNCKFRIGNYKES